MGKFDSIALPVDKPARMLIEHPITGLPLKGPNGEEGYIDLFAFPDSDAAKKQQRVVSDRRIARARGNRGRAPTAAEIEAENVEMLTVLTVGWRLVSLDGQVLDVPFTTENARELYAEGKMGWLREQVDEFTAKRSNFSLAS